MLDSPWLPSPFVFRRGASGGGTEPPPNPLAAFYGAGAGQIDLHLTPEDATATGGAISAIPNRGGAGAALNVAVTGTGPALALPFMSFDAATGLPALASIYSLIGRRLFFVLRTPNLASGPNLFGQAGPPGYVLRLIANASGVRPQIWTNESGSALTLNNGGYGPDDTDAHLYEVEISGGRMRSFIDGVALGDAAFAWTAFNLSRIGRGTGNVTTYVGDMGDLVSVVIGTGSDAAIAAVRAYLNDRFSLGLTL